VRRLAIRLRVLLGALPVGLERLLGAAFGAVGDSTAVAAAIPWLLAVLAAAGAGVVALVLASLARDYLIMAIAGGAGLGAMLLSSVPELVTRRTSPMLGLQLLLMLLGMVLGGVAGAWLAPAIAGAPVASALVSGAVVGLLVLARRVRLRRWGESTAREFDPVAAVVWGLVVLSLLPALQAGAEIIITRATVPEFARRQVSRAELIDIHGLALHLPFEAEAPVTEAGPAAGDYRWLVLRDQLPDRQMALVRTRVGDVSLQRRDTLARVRSDLNSGNVMQAMQLRGIEVPDGAARPGGSLLLQAVSEEVSVGEDVHQLSSLADASALPDRSIVRITLEYPGHAVASCVLEDDCDARRLGRGAGPWLHLARDGTGAVAVVQLGYPASAAPIQLVGRQESDLGASSRFLDDPWNRLLFGWAQVQRRAGVEHDPTLPVDRLWVGPILFTVLAVLLVAGRRAGYPVFETQTVVPAGSLAGGSVPLTVSGWLSVPGRSPLELSAAPGRLVGDTGGATSLSVTHGGETIEAEVPRALGALSGLEAGALRYVAGSQPALRVGWYGSQLELTFANSADRDAAIRQLRGD
jgi:hypothetical protein